jgi:SAM-dependent methyltransferase
VKRCLVAGTINRYEAPEGWEYVHLDAQDRLIYDQATRRMVRPDVVGDIRQLPFGDEAFDRVQLWDVLEHLGEREAHAALWEIHRVLRPGGELDVQVPNVRVAAAWYLDGRLSLPEFNQVLYGERLPEHGEADWHRFGWTAGSLHGALVGARFEPGPDLGAGTIVARFRAVRR